MEPFGKGDLVRVKDDRLATYVTEFRNKVRGGRVGVVRGYPVGRFGHCKDPIVYFPAWGRRKEYRPGQVNVSDLVLVARAGEATDGL